MSSLPDPQPAFEPLEQPRSPWSMADLIVFGIFFALTVLFLPVSVIRVWRIVDPDLGLSNLTATDQVVLQGLMNLVIVGFIIFLIRVVHRQSVVETIHWSKNYHLGTGFLISLG